MEFKKKNKQKNAMNAMEMRSFSRLFIRATHVLCVYSARFVLAPKMNMSEAEL